MNTYLRLVYRNLRANLDRASLFFELIFPLFFIFVQGFGINGIVPPFDIGNGRFVSYSLFLAAGAVTLTVINGGTNAGTQLWFDRKNGMFEQILMGPFTRAQYILSIYARPVHPEHHPGHPDHRGRGVPPGVRVRVPGRGR